MPQFKVGDSVFVVQQQTRNGKEWRTSTETVSKVGTKYAYINRYGRDLPFHKHNGEIAHKEGCDRANGYGFDVYTSEEEWRLKLHAVEEFKRLKERLCDNWGHLKPLSFEVVKSIHDVLDKWEHDTEGSKVMTDDCT